MTLQVNISQNNRRGVERNLGWGFNSIVVIGIY